MKTLVITGGSQGLGRAIAEHLHSEYKVYILARNEKDLKTLANQLDCKYRVCNVVNYDETESVLADIAEDAGSIDILINNAGVYIQGELEENEISAIKTAIDVNINGVINCTKAVIPYMKKQGAGPIIQMNSQSGLYGKAKGSVYRASKWAITGFVKSLQSEMELHNIKVVGIYPGALDTDFFSKSGVEKDMSDALPVTEVAKTIKFILELDETTYIQRSV